MLGRLVSLVYAVVEPDGAVTVANAGHCPPLIVHADGTTVFFGHATRPPIGVGRSVVDPTGHRLAEGDALVLYTDGLIERRSESIDEGLRRLADRAGDLIRPDLATGLARIVDDVRGPDADDDVAVVALRRQGS
jgi:serine phosphatase RsbU (regulator of sigma subunit)